MELSIEEITLLYRKAPNYEPDIKEVISNTFYALSEMANISDKIFEGAMYLDSQRSKTYMNSSDFVDNIIDRESFRKMIDDSDSESSKIVNVLEAYKRTQSSALDLLRIMFDKLVKLPQKQDATPTHQDNPPNMGMDDVQDTKPIAQNVQDVHPTTQNIQDIQPITQNIQAISLNIISPNTPVFVQRTITENQNVYCRYYPNCTFCLNNKLVLNDSTYYCIQDCTYCSSLRKGNKNHTKEIIRTITNILPVRDPIYINTNDIYFYVILMSHNEDGPNDYLESVMIKNFKQMFPPSRPSKVNAYVIEKNDDSAPILSGLIRYDKENFPVGTRISTKSNHIKNHYKSFHTGEMVKHRQYNVQNLTTYKGKQYLTQTDIIIEKYNIMISKGNVMGSTIENFIQ